MDRYSVSRTKRSLFYLMMAFLIVGFIIAECILPSERSQSVSDNNITYEATLHGRSPMVKGRLLKYPAGTMLSRGYDGHNYCSA